MSVRRRIAVAALSSLIGTIEWSSELRRRWPMIVAVLRGREVAYGLRIDHGTLVVQRHGACIYDTTIIGAQTGISGSA